MKPLAHQIKFSQLCWDYFKENGYVYLAGKPRSGKTLTALLTVEKSEKATKWLVLTKIKAISGWLKFIDDKELNLKHTYIVTNYEQLGRVVKIINKQGKVTGKKIELKLNPKNFDGIIIDESHNYGKVGKAAGKYAVLKAFAKNLPHMHLSGTATVESENSIYYQMAISKFTPFRQNNFYTFFERYGIPYTIKIRGREVNQYDKSKPSLREKIDAFTIYMTQEDAGISKDLQAVDKLHYVELSDKTKELYNNIVDYGVAYLDNNILICDTEMKERISLHMIEGGTVKIDDKVTILGNTEKIDYIKANFGDAETVGIMSHFIGERELLKQVFKHAKIYSSISDAEGVDLSHLKYFIIFSSDYSGEKHIQRRDRIVNLEGSASLKVHYLLVKGGVSEQVYKVTSKKEKFNNETYIKTKI